MRVKRRFTMQKISAGLLMYRWRERQIEVLLVHPGGPFWRNKDLGAWSIPKGGVNPGEELLIAAKREFQEETGSAVEGVFLPLQPVKMKSGKVVHAWAIEGAFDTSTFKSISCSLEWPPKSGRTIEFPEIDRAAFFDLSMARKKMLPAQTPFLDQLLTLVQNQ